MPARTVNQSVRDQAETSARVVQLAGQADDPIVYVRIRWGAYNAGTRILTMQVIDRLDKAYAPRSFKGYKRTPGTADGRWIVSWYIAETEFGTPLTAGGVYTAGKQFADLSGFILSETDETGKIVVPIAKGGTEAWCHAGVGMLLRSRGIDWVNAAADPEQGQGTAGSGDLGKEITGHE